MKHRAERTTTNGVANSEIIAGGFQPNGFYERLITMRRTDRKTFDGFSIPTRLALAEYEKQKRQFEQLKSQ
jgi:hypothetical protein